MSKSVMRSITFSVVTLMALAAVSMSIADRISQVLPCQANPEPDLDWNDHLGPVESIRIEDAEMFYADKPLLRQITKFNHQGQKVEAVPYRDDGVALPKSTSSYDAVGRLLKAHHYQVNGTIWLENTYTYNSDGTLKDDIQRDLEESNKVITRKSYSHDLKRNLTEISEFDGDGKLREHFGFVRDAQCRIIEAYGYNKDNSLRGKAIPVYDGKNNVIESTVYSDTGAILERQRFDYEFDERGNWIKQVSSKWLVENGKEVFKPQHITFRKFTYY